jgi:hypothetical protein
MEEDSESLVKDREGLVEDLVKETKPTPCPSHYKLQLTLSGKLAWR